MRCNPLKLVEGYKRPLGRNERKVRTGVWSGEWNLVLSQWKEIDPQTFMSGKELTNHASLKMFWLCRFLKWLLQKLLYNPLKKTVVSLNML